MKGTEVKWLASWGLTSWVHSHITFSAQNRPHWPAGPSLWLRSGVTALPDEPHSRHPGGSLPQMCQVPTYPGRSHWPLLCFHCSSARIPHQAPSRPWSGSLLKVTSERPSLPSLLLKTTAHWLTLSSIWPVLFFRTSLPGIVHIFCFVCLLPPEHKLQEREDSQILLTFGSPVTTTAETPHVLHKCATDTLAEDRIRYAPATA